MILRKETVSGVGKPSDQSSSIESRNKNVESEGWRGIDIRVGEVRHNWTNLILSLYYFVVETSNIKQVDDHETVQPNSNGNEQISTAAMAERRDFQQANNLVMDTHFESDSQNDGYTEEPSGAVVSLTLGEYTVQYGSNLHTSYVMESFLNSIRESSFAGLFVTFIMVFVIVYRLKIVRKRIRRGGKLPYAHDADFLVNGMYL